MTLRPQQLEVISFHPCNTPLALQRFRPTCRAEYPATGSKIGHSPSDRLPNSQLRPSNPAQPSHSSTLQPTPPEPKPSQDTPPPSSGRPVTGTTQSNVELAPCHWNCPSAATHLPAPQSSHRRSMGSGETRQVDKQAGGGRGSRAATMRSRARRLQLFGGQCSHGPESWSPAPLGTSGGNPSGWLICTAPRSQSCSNVQWSAQQHSNKFS